MVIILVLVAIGLAWLAFPVYTGILLFGVEVDVKCFADNAGSPADVAKRFNNTLIILLSSQLCITVSLILLCVS
jgi:hypothetical protein